MLEPGLPGLLGDPLPELLAQFARIRGEIEALGLALPGNGTVVATHADRKGLFLEAGRLIVDLAKRYYEQDDASVLPRSIATVPAFRNAMALDTDSMLPGV